MECSTASLPRWTDLEVVLLYTKDQIQYHSAFFASNITYMEHSTYKTEQIETHDSSKKKELSVMVV